MAKLSWDTCDGAGESRTPVPDPLVLGLARAIRAGICTDDDTTTWLARRSDRGVCRLRVCVEKRASCVLKFYVVRRWRNLRHYSRHGPREYRNLRQVARHNALCPRPHALVERSVLGLPLFSAIIMEDLAPLISLSSALRDGIVAVADLPAHLERIGQLLRHLHAQGINHTDVGAANVMVDPSGALAPRLIDCESVTVLSKPSLNALAMQAGILLRSLAPWGAPHEFRDWFLGLHPGLDTQWDAVVRLCIRKPSRRERLLGHLSENELP